MFRAPYLDISVGKYIFHRPLPFLTTGHHDIPLVQSPRKTSTVPNFS